MNLNTKHQIKRIQIELETATQALGFEAQREVKLAFEKILPDMERLLDERDPGDLHVSLNDLVLDLGTIQLDDFGQKMLEAFEKALDEELPRNHIRQLGAEEKLQWMTQEQKHLELLLYFLKHGHYPWWAQSVTGYDKEAVLEKWISENPESSQLFFQQHLPDPSISKRLLLQFSEKAFYQVLHILPSPKSWLQQRVLDQLRHAFMTLPDADSATFRMQFKLAVLESLFTSTSDGNAENEQQMNQLLLTILMRNGFNAVIGSSEQLGTALDLIGLRPGWLHERELDEWTKTLKSREEKTQFLSEIVTLAISNTLTQHQVQMALQSRSGQSSRSLIAALMTNLQQKQLKPDWLTEQKLASYVEPLPTMVAKKQFLAAVLDLAEKHLLTEDRLEQLADPNQQSEADPVQKRKFPSQAPKLPENEIYVSNAGIILLWNYLPRFFKNLELTENHAFKDDEKRFTAIGLLHYLTTGSTQCPEEEMTLNKLLCGLDFSEPVPEELKLSVGWETECIDLLEAVIRNWSILRNTSVEGFRESFLMRNGRLTIMDDGWCLQVERKAFDMLLDSLPYGISFIKLDWMETPLYVEW